MGSREKRVRRGEGGVRRGELRESLRCERGQEGGLGGVSGGRLEGGVKRGE